MVQYVLRSTIMKNILVYLNTYSINPCAAVTIIDFPASFKSDKKKKCLFNHENE